MAAELCGLRGTPKRSSGCLPRGYVAGVVDVADGVTAVTTVPVVEWSSGTFEVGGVDVLRLVVFAISTSRITPMLTGCQRCV